MSGGYFDYEQNHIEHIANKIEEILNRQGKEKPKDELYMRDDYYKKYPEEKFYPTFSNDVQVRLVEAVRQLRVAAIYVGRIDWLLSGDDDEHDFIKRLENELWKLNQ